MKKVVCGFKKILALNNTLWNCLRLSSFLRDGNIFVFNPQSKPCSKCLSPRYTALSFTIGEESDDVHYVFPGAAEDLTSWIVQLVVSILYNMISVKRTYTITVSAWLKILIQVPLRTLLSHSRSRIEIQICAWDNKEGK